MITRRFWVFLGFCLLQPAMTPAELPLERDPNPPRPEPPATSHTRIELPVAGGKTNAAVLRLTATLTDGSRLIGLPSVALLPVQTTVGDLTIKLDLIQSIQRAATGAVMVVRLKNGDQLQGTVKLASLTLNTCFGRVVLPVETITGITVTITGGAGNSVNDGLVFHYKFDDENTNIVAHGVRNQAQDGLGKVGSFSGRDSYVAIPDRDSFEFGPHDQFTVAAWVKPEAAHGTQAIVVKAPTELPPEGGWEWGIHFEESRRFAAGWERHHLVHSKTEPQLNTWYHVAVTYADGNWKMFVNGKSEAETSDEFITARHGVVAIGRKGEQRAYADWFQGQIGDVRIYKRALTADEIAALQQPSP